MIKKLKLLLISMIGMLGLSSIVLGNYEDFLDQLRLMNIPVDEIIESDELSRYELTRLLNAVECQDCIYTPSWMVNRYTQPFWNNFIQLPGKDFDDVEYREGYWNGYSYYYCVAYVGDNVYMRGYPEGISPVCNGAFCGTRNVTKAEFIQVIINLIGQYVYQQYSVNWDDVQKWMIGLEPGSRADTYLNQDDKNIILEEAEKCDDEICDLSNKGVLQTYLKYCMFNIEQCSMQTFGKVVQGYWPVAELNVLYQQGIMPLQEANKDNIHSHVDGEQVLEMLYQLFKIIDCDFNNDYDCDVLDNANDNCPNYYNPTQTDTDQDGIGDVCDSDIDGDGILNPIGIVDDLGNIVIANWDENGDNCIFTANTNQKNTDDNRFGDRCQEQEDKLAVYINADNVNGSAPLTVDLSAITKGTVDKVRWNLGDNTTAEGDSVSHTYLYPGVYQVKIQAEGPYNNAFAQTTIIVGDSIENHNGIQIRTDTLGDNPNLNGNFWLDSMGKIDEVVWRFGDGVEMQKKANQSISRVLDIKGQYSLTAKAFRGGTLVGVSSINLGVGSNNVGSSLQASNVNPKVGDTITMQTNLYNISPSDIAGVQWDWGDGTFEENTSLVASHKYNEFSKFVVIQKILLSDGNVLTNTLTLNVTDDAFFKSHVLNLTPNKLWSDVNKEVNFDISMAGDVAYSASLIHKNTEEESEVIFKPTLPTSFTHNYIKEGFKYPKTILNINQCLQLQNQATLSVDGADTCLAAMLEGTLNQFKCDFDEDGIPDICDNDIDGDGLPNLIGIIKYENPDCSITPDNLNNDLDGTSLDDLNNMNGNILSKHIDVCTLDNCPLTVNKDQTDLDINGIGDDCDSYMSDLLDNSNGNNNGNSGNGDSNNNGGNDGDIDGDGILDGSDSCPEIKENYNGLFDLDGCPEIDEDINCPDYIKLPSLPDYAILDCGNGLIEPGETCLNCPEDVGECDNTSDPYCGDGLIAENETCLNCPEDIGECDGDDDENLCGNGIIDEGETCLNCPEDIGECPLVTAQCISCPCNFSDFASDLVNADNVRAILRDTDQTILYNVSNQRKIEH